jgi:CubicO group peptidase (beta-lactamase class C family)
VSDPLASALDEILARAQVAQRMPSVVAAVFRDGEVVWGRALGLADVERAEEATLDHVYRVGSITKTFTAVAIMQLRDAGRLELDAPVHAYVPEFPDGPTVRQALSHLAGIQREPPGEVWETMEAPTRDELLAGLADAEQVLPPGARWHYSNLAFATLGEVVARAGDSYERTLRERILDPLALERTRLVPEGRRATPYFVDPYADRVRVEPDPEVTESTGAAGWLWSTVGDLARWADFFCTGAAGVLAKETLDEMARVQTMVDHDRWTLGWGLGLELYRHGDRVLAGHGGAMPGFLAGVCVERRERTGAAVLTNTGAGADPETLAVELACVAIDRQPRVPPRWEPRDVPSETDELLGLWWVEGSPLEISYRDGRLQAELMDGPVGRRISYLEPDGTDRWRVVEGREQGELVRAVRDENGMVVKLYVATYPVTRHPSTFGEPPNGSEMSGPYGLRSPAA